jgi:predicted amidophosphoribosyltransferase
MAKKSLIILCPGCSQALRPPTGLCTNCGDQSNPIDPVLMEAHRTRVLVAALQNILRAATSEDPNSFQIAIQRDEPVHHGGVVLTYTITVRL